MSTARPRLYDLLPAYIRFRDAHPEGFGSGEQGPEGEPLRVLMEALEWPFEVILEDLDALYRGWFIETCERWEVPYIGDLLGVRGLESARHALPSHRTRVANALAYRRSKGTAAALERAAADATGWACHAVDYRQSLAATASLLTPAAGGGTADLRRMGALDGLGGPFNVLSHGADLRPSDPANPPLGDRGGFHPLSLGLAFWRLQSLPVSAATPCEVVAGAGYTFHPFGLDIPLFNPPQTAVPSVYTSTRRQLPEPLNQEVLAKDLAGRRAGTPEALGPEGYFSGEPAFQILVADPGDESGFWLVPLKDLEICDLQDWTAPASFAEGGDGEDGHRVAVDPVRGRFLFRKVDPERRVQVDYSYGLGMDLGGGPYPRQPPSAGTELGVPSWRAVVAQDCTPRYDAEEKLHYFNSLSAAVQAWSTGRPLPIPPPNRTVVTPRSGAILICDSGTYEGDLSVSVKGRWLAIQAAEGCCPALRGGLTVVGSPARILEAAVPVPDSVAPRAESPADNAFRQSQLVLGGLRMEGGVSVQGGASLLLEHCTIAPPVSQQAGSPVPAVRFVAEEEPAEGIAGVHAAERTTVQAVRCILGGLDLAARPVELDLADCIVDGGGGKAIDGVQAAARLARCTIFGEVQLSRLSAATGVLFERRVRVAVPSEGLIRFCYVASGSRTPPQERCIGGGARIKTSSGGAAAPVFTSRSYGDPAYAQLSPDASFELRQGGEDGNEIGVYNSLRQSDRLAALSSVLDVFLPWGMNARLSFVT